MSTGKGLAIQVGGVAVGGASAGRAAASALGAATTTALEFLAKAAENARDERQRAEIEKRRIEIAELKGEIESGQRAAANMAENLKKLQLGRARKSIETRLEAVSRRRQQVAPTLAPTAVRQSKAKAGVGTLLDLEREVADLQSELRRQEEEVRTAITAALEMHTAGTDSVAAIERMVSLPLPPLERPADLVGYFEEAQSLWRRRRDDAARKSLADSLHRALGALPEEVPPTLLAAIGAEIKALASAPSEAAAQVVHGRAMDLVARAREDARNVAVLKDRMTAVRKDVQELMYAELSSDDQEVIADVGQVPAPDVIQRLEEHVQAARMQDHDRIVDQQRRFVRAATLDVLQQLGYETSVVDETTWFKNGSMFISRSDWGDFVVRITSVNGSLRVFAGRHVGDGAEASALGPLTPEMNRRYKARIDAWCGKYLGDLVKNLDRRGITAKVTELDVDPSLIQPVLSKELGEQMARRIEQRVRDDDASKRAGASGGAA